MNITKEPNYELYKTAHELWLELDLLIANLELGKITSCNGEAFTQLIKLRDKAYEAFLCAFALAETRKAPDGS